MYRGSTLFVIARKGLAAAEVELVAEREPPNERVPATAASILRRQPANASGLGDRARRLVASPVIEIIGTLCPDEFPFPPGHHMPVPPHPSGGDTRLPQRRPCPRGSLGGNWHAEDNLIAACTPCNEAKSDRLGWTTLEHERDEDWHGLTELYRRLTQRLPEVRTYHRDWLRALGV
jgi:hypothetical protein